MLSVSEVDLVLLFGPRVEPKVRLLREVVDGKNEADDARLRNESLGLLNFSTKLSWLSPVT